MAFSRAEIGQNQVLGHDSAQGRLATPRRSPALLPEAEEQLRAKVTAAAEVSPRQAALLTPLGRLSRSMAALDPFQRGSTAPRQAHRSSGSAF